MNERKSVTPPTARAAAALAVALAAPALLALAMPAAAADDLRIEPLPVFTPSASGSVSLPAQSSSPVPSVPLYVPGLYVPGTCNLDPCHASTLVPGRAVAVEGIPGQGAEVPGLEIPDQCTPGGLACVPGRAVEGQALGPTPDIPGLEAAMPDLLVPAACTAAGDLCLGPYEVERRGLLETPAVGPAPLTPSVGAGYALPGLAASLGPDSIGTDSTGAIQVGAEAPVVGAVHVATLCQAGCPVPTATLPVEATGDASLFAQVGADRHELPDL